MLCELKYSPTYTIGQDVGTLNNPSCTRCRHPILRPILELSRNFSYPFAMTDPTAVKLMKWPFFVGDAILLAFAWFVYHGHEGAFSSVEAVLFVCCGIVGAVLAVMPYVLEYLAAVKMVETGAVVSTISQIQNLEALAAQIGGATSQWQTVQEHAQRTNIASKEISERMSAETAAFTDFLKKANDSERATLRLEVEKLHRAENDWLQVVVRLLDHTYGLNQAAVRSGQPSLIDQLGQFQNACRDVARRIGLVPFVATPDAPFDPKVHESPDSQAVSMANPRVRDTIATGYTYQGKLIRPALVALQNPPPQTADAPTSAPIVTTIAPIAAPPPDPGEPTLL